MPKNIVVLLDGTGQEGGRRVDLNTNVYKIYTLLEDRSPRQEVFYDRGVGAGWRKISGNIGGAGISNRILRAYRFIHDHYEHGDRIFLIGFSRGATEVRSLANFLEVFQFLPESRPDLIKRAWKIYRTRLPLRWWARRRIVKHRRYGARGRRWNVPIRWLTRRWTDEWDLRDPFDVVTALLPERTRFEYRKRYGHAWEERVSELREEKKALAPEELADLIREETANVFLPAERKWGEDPAADAVWSDVDDACWRLSFFTGVFDDESDPAAWLRTFTREERAARFLSASGSDRGGARVPIHFVGCFDTVAALGLPFPRLKRLTDRLPGMYHSFHDLTLSGFVTHACQALALDERRRAFSPEVWEASTYQRSHQVWFSGVHTDVGGGYLERGLSDITLAWMLRMGHTAGLLLRNRAGVHLVEDPRGVLHDSRDTWLKKWLFGKQIREPAERGDVTLHRTVIERMSEEGPIWEWRDGGPVEVASPDYRSQLRSVLGAGLDAGRYHVDGGEPEPFDLGELVRAQDEMWSAWKEADYDLHWPMSALREAWGHAQTGETGRALELLAGVPESGYEKEIGLVYGELGELDRAFAYLAEAYARHPTSLRHLSLHPWTAPLREDPRFDELMERLGGLGYEVDSPVRLLRTAWDRARRGEREQALEILANPSVPESFFRKEIGLIHGELGELDRAFECLGEELAYHPTSLRALSAHPWASRLRPDPRFDELMERLEALGMR